MSVTTRRAAGAVLIAFTTLFAVEGVVATFGGSSLLRRLPLDWATSAADLAWRSRSEDERKLAAAANPGILRLHPDPRVGYVLRSDSQLEILGGRIHSDELGLRARPRPWPDGDPLVIAIAGASVPFGFGLSDEETIAHRLEEMLAASRGPDARPIVCRTVAMTRWSTRNAVSFLFDHLTEVRPDIVVYMAYPNELSDTDIVSETGHRECFPDPMSADPWVPVCAGDTRKLMSRLQLVTDETGVPPRPEDFGVDVLNSDISPESRRRYDENAEHLLRLAGWLDARGGALLVAPCIEQAYGFHLLQRLRSRVPGLLAAPLLARIPPEMTLGYDPHPNAVTAFVLATLIAQALFDHGLVDCGAGGPLPEVPPEYEALRARALDTAAVEAGSSRKHDEARRHLQPAIGFTTGHSIGQIYGGVSENGLVGPRALVLLAPGGSGLDIELEPIAERSDLYPLDVSVVVDGSAAGFVTLTVDGPVRAWLPLPPRVDPGAPLEVKLVASRWVVLRVGGTWELAAFKPLRIACSDG